MTELNKLITTLKGVDEIKESLEELKFWTEVIVEDENFEIVDTAITDRTTGEDNALIKFKVLCSNKEYKEKDIIEIIWNPIQYNHLLRYFKSINKFTIALKTDSSLIEIWWNKDWSALTICKFNLTKDLQDQSEETLKKINNFISNLK